MANVFWAFTSHWNMIFEHLQNFGIGFFSNYTNYWHIFLSFYKLSQPPDHLSWLDLPIWKLVQTPHQKRYKFLVVLVVVTYLGTNTGLFSLVQKLREFDKEETWEVLRIFCLHRTLQLDCRFFAGITKLSFRMSRCTLQYGTVVTVHVNCFLENGDMTYELSSGRPWIHFFKNISRAEIDCWRKKLWP